MTTQTHQFATQALVQRKLSNGQLGETIVKSDDWAHAVERYWNAAPFLEFASGEKLHYSCSYRNTRPSCTTVGVSFRTNEKCMAIGYFFPASAGWTCGL